MKTVLILGGSGGIGKVLTKIMKDKYNVTSLSSKNLLSASAIAKPSFLTAAKTISLSFLKCVGRFSNSNPFFLTIFKASDLVIIFFLQK
jgi:hypothetical protein